MACCPFDDGDISEPAALLRVRRIAGLRALFAWFQIPVTRPGCRLRFGSKGTFAHLDILPERLYCYLECLPKNRTNHRTAPGHPGPADSAHAAAWPDARPRHRQGYRIQLDDVLQVEQGSLYPALHRLIKRGWISSEEGTSENNRRAKFYRLTAKGRRQLAIETGKWEKLAGAIARILRPLEREGES